MRPRPKGDAMASGNMAGLGAAAAVTGDGFAAAPPAQPAAAHP